MNVQLRMLMLCALAMLAPATEAAQDSASIQQLFRSLKTYPDDLARYRYLVKQAPQLPLDDRMMALQLLATTENELGLYGEALSLFPIDSRKAYIGAIPTPADWSSQDAVQAIAKAAEGRQLVLVNEAHHDAHTRELTLALLPRLRAMGFTYFAAEALGDNDPDLMKRGYPRWDSGSEYLHEPMLGEILRKATQLGFIIVPYEADSDSTAGRESAQANNLYQRVFAKDPHARLFVHAGYAHVDKAPGRLGDAKPMAAVLAKLSGIEPLSIDQTQFRDANPRLSHFAYDQLVAQFQPSRPVVLVNRSSGALWSSEPALHDISVILPPDANAAKAIKEAPSWYTLDGQAVAARSMKATLSRPDWLDLGGQRFALPINTTLCGSTIPCIVEAFYLREPYDAVAADRYAFVGLQSRTDLYLFPGKYRLRARDAEGKVLSEQTVTVQLGAAATE